MRRLATPVVTTVLVLGVSGVAGHPAQGSGSAKSLTVATDGTPVCTVQDERLPEISGLVATEVGYVVVNDSSDSDSRLRIFFLDQRCAVTRSIPYPSRPRDTEDLARSRDGTIWVGDIGDNDRVRRTVALWKLAPGRRTPVLHRLSYPDGAHDAEALLLSGDGTPIIVTKDDSGTSELYSPSGTLRAGRTVPMRKVGAFTLPRSTTRNPFSIFGRRLVTGGAVAPDGSRVVLRTYADALEFDVIGGDVARAVTEGTPRIIPLPDEPQGESISYSPDGTSLLTISETADSSPDLKSRILSYPLADPGPKPPSYFSSGPSGAGSGAPSRAAESGPDESDRLVAAAVAVGLVLAAVGAFGARRSRRPTARSSITGKSGRP